jgi:methyl-accepting chemotaxis protein
MEQISTTVKKNADNARHANELIGATRITADKGGEIVSNAVAAMSRIEESSRRISDIISVIDEIARQTNLLALNAAVEAARAGEAGRGFAVVASEVRSLAQRSSQAAKDIKNLITNSSDQVQEGVQLVHCAGEALKNIVASVKGVVDIVADISKASDEQAGGIDQINKALVQMDEMTQQNSALVEENAASVRTLEQMAARTDERVAIFKTSSAAESAKASRPAVQPTAKPRASAKVQPLRSPARRMQAQLAAAVTKDQAWDEF